MWKNFFTPIDNELFVFLSEQLNKTSNDLSIDNERINKKEITTIMYNELWNAYRRCDDLVASEHDVQTSQTMLACIISRLRNLKDSKAEYESEWWNEIKSTMVSEKYY